jgi:hypothetical protein
MGLDNFHESFGRSLYIRTARASTKEPGGADDDAKERQADAGEKHSNVKGQRAVEKLYPLCPG